MRGGRERLRVRVYVCDSKETESSQSVHNRLHKTHPLVRPRDQRRSASAMARKLLDVRASRHKSFGMARKEVNMQRTSRGNCNRGDEEDAAEEGEMTSQSNERRERRERFSNVLTSTGGGEAYASTGCPANEESN